MPGHWAFREISGAAMPHAKYHSSLASIAEGLACSCGSSFSSGCGHGGRLAARRLFGNSELSVEGLLSGHFEQTAARLFGKSLVLALQETFTGMPALVARTFMQWPPINPY